MNEATQLALVAMVVAVVGPLLMAWLTSRNKRIEKEQDFDRQDEVTKDLREHGKKLDQIHTLVNSDKTTALQANLAALKSLRVLLINGGKHPNPETIITVEATTNQIDALEAELKERMEATARADADLASSAPPKEA